MNNYVADIEPLLSKLKIFLNRDLHVQKTMFDKQNEEHDVIELNDNNTNIIKEDLVE